MAKQATKQANRDAINAAAKQRRERQFREDVEQQENLRYQARQSELQHQAIKLQQDDVGRITQFKHVSWLEQLRDMGLLSQEEFAHADHICDQYIKLEAKPCPMALEIGGRDVFHGNDDSEDDVKDRANAIIKRYKSHCHNVGEKVAIEWTQIAGTATSQLIYNWRIKATVRHLRAVFGRIK